MGRDMERVQHLNLWSSIPEGFPQIEGGNILLAASGPSYIYNSKAVLRYIREYRPIIIGIGGYFHGLLKMRGKDIHKEIYRPDADMSLAAQYFSEQDIEDLMPNILFSFAKRNWDLYDEKGTTDTKNKTIKKMRSHRSEIYEGCDGESEPLQTNLSYIFVDRYKDEIKRRSIWVCIPEPDFWADRRPIYFGRPRDWNYDRYIYYQAYNHSKRIMIEDLDMSGDPDHMRFGDNQGIKFMPRKGGDMVLSWILRWKPSRFAYVGIDDRYMYRSTERIRAWWWQEPARKYPPSMFISSPYILNEMSKLLGNNLCCLNLLREA